MGELLLLLSLLCACTMASKLHKYSYYNDGLSQHPEDSRIFWWGGAIPDLLMMVAMKGTAEGRTGSLGTVWWNWDKHLCVCWGELCMMGTCVGWFWYIICGVTEYMLFGMNHQRKKKELKLCFARITSIYVYKLLFVQSDCHTKK